MKRTSFVGPRSKYAKGKAARYYSLNIEKWNEAMALLREHFPFLFKDVIIDAKGPSDKQ